MLIISMTEKKDRQKKKKEWMEKIKGLIFTYLGGQESGKALANILCGLVNPSGKLAETYAYELEDYSSNNFFPGDMYNSLYKESIYLGYRYFDKIGKNVLGEFGYGLSYSSFNYDNMKIQVLEKNIIVTADIINIGDYEGIQRIIY